MTIRILMVFTVGMTGAAVQAASFSRITPLQLPEEPALLSLDNDVVNLPSGPLFINIWASWCKPCIDELPALNALKARYDDGEIQWIALNYGDSLAQVHRFMETTSIELPVLLDATTQFTRQLPMKGLPVTFLVDRNGRVLFQMDGYADWTDPELIREWEALMPELISPP
jgi:thiol-disulfide isomerase/thioredoxin